ncbi:Nif3-like dinuclear metal center hexameric protein [Methanothermobacter wolfeii]|uniref:Nif3-like dinuclear metal center hexameric protein n=2 Tax=Methanobacteriaceae TaxID=2159 RepID=A0A9E7RSI4_METWO|nr:MULTISPECIES: Nif3-like dinuclear metal center hexameric protein [Methanothermobacter]MDI6702117.1 Nif3-like dinuclear metal center hexameric protein [Methanothermobacter wolfeii]MDI6842410.1 Nif3-like dinuclear metal center hexameric protein [Methanothermobacter wolfeii]UXH31428.1 Nif3-like dinuclear metal center hexameric protein [Methanothermobacter wolfeii]SCM58276.1 GTP cyclohydrolase 1 type 2 homolog [Methanothermobacter wolfeii]
MNNMLKGEKIRIEEFVEIMNGIAPESLALEGDPVGYHGPDISVESALIMMDYIEGAVVDGYDLLVLHHPPLLRPPVPYYVIHSNWDVADGGACDALAEALNLYPESLLDPATGIGRICSGDIYLDELLERVSGLNPSSIRIVNPAENIDRVAVVSGFGLSQEDLIIRAFNEGVSAFISGDLTHRCAVLARNLQITLVDAGHYSTEMPGLLRLRDIIEDFGITADILDTGTPWQEYMAPD